MSNPNNDLNSLTNRTATDLTNAIRRLRFPPIDDIRTIVFAYLAQYAADLTVLYMQSCPPQSKLTEDVQKLKDGAPITPVV